MHISLEALTFGGCICMMTPLSIWGSHCAGMDMSCLATAASESTTKIAVIGGTVVFGILIISVAVVVIVIAMICAKPCHGFVTNDRNVG